MTDASRSPRRGRRRIVALVIVLAVVAALLVVTELVVRQVVGNVAATEIERALPSAVSAEVTATTTGSCVLCEVVVGVQDHGLRTWAMTAAIRHPGVGMAEGDRRDQYGRGLTELLDVAARASLISDIVFLVRTVPDDGAERQQWIATHRRPDGPELARRMNDELATALTRAAVRTEAFVSFVVPETRIAKQAREFGGGLEGRTRVDTADRGVIEHDLAQGPPVRGPGQLRPRSGHRLQ